MEWGTAHLYEQVLFLILLQTLFSILFILLILYLSLVDNHINDSNCSNTVANWFDLFDGDATAADTVTSIREIYGSEHMSKIPLDWREGGLQILDTHYY